MTDSSILTLTEVAHYLRLTTRTVSELVKKGELQAFRPSGRKLMFRKQAVEFFIEKRRIA